MKKDVKNHLYQVLSHLYINPLEKCNLHCRICYTRKTSLILQKKDILEFIERYQKTQKIETVTFCGGEVFTLKYFPELVNALVENKIFIQVITNGIIDKLDEFENPNMINLIVSIDGLREYHDKNRGEGNFDKSINFLSKARSLGFHTEIFSIVTRQNYPHIAEFEEYINKTVILNDLPMKAGVKNPVRNSELVGDPSSRNTGLRMTPLSGVTYHPRKPPAYLMHHPVSNIRGITEGFDFLNRDEMMTLIKTRKTFPPKDLGCFQISLASDGNVYGCCEGTKPIGKIDDDIELLFTNLEKRLEIWDKENPPAGGWGGCLGCSQPDFVCGIKKYLVDLSSRT